jgi:hypothetical protein
MTASVSEPAVEARSVLVEVGREAGQLAGARPLAHEH